MPDYVYALHDFHPENEDEVSFRAGERIEVIEKDDLYSDGWWQGRNLQGKEGLFPQSYTTPAPPSNPAQPPRPAQPSTDAPTLPNLAFGPSPLSVGSTHLQTLKEEPESQSRSTSAGDPTPAGEGMMKATLTDVQKAIEQLGRRVAEDGDRDGGRSFSFDSSREPETDRETETGTDEDVDNVLGEDWHKGARRKLAEVLARGDAELEMERQMEAERRGMPTIQLELSDESEGEDEGEHPPHPKQPPPKIADGQEPNGSAREDIRTPNGNPPSPGLARLLVPSPTPIAASQEDDPPRTATQDTFPATAAAPRTPTNTDPVPAVDVTVPMGTTASLPTPISAGPSDQPVTPLFKLAIPDKAPTQTTAIPHHHLPSPETSKHSSLSSSINGGDKYKAEKEKEKQKQKEPKRDEKKDIPPHEWTLEQVAEWLKSKGFDQDVCDKFTEQEITGDVLLDLDVNLLKTEIGIHAFGKRMRIANAIAQLRRPPSVIYSDTSPAQSPYGISPGMYAQGPGQMQLLQGQAMGSVPGSASMPNAQFRGSVGQGQYDQPSPSLINGSESTASMARYPGPEDGGNAGLGVWSAQDPKTRPAQLAMSPSESNLSPSQSKHSSGTGRVEFLDEERAVMSESEVVPAAASVRRRFFGLSDSSSITGNGRSEPSNLSSPTRSESGQTESSGKTTGVGARRKRTSDGSVKGGGERLSLFGIGGTLTGGLGKVRKPPPKYSGETERVSPEKEKSGGGLSRFYGQSRRSTSKGTSPKDAYSLDHPDGSSHSVLRKRTMSTATLLDDAPRPSAAVLKPGQSVLEQIGRPDHKGWLRKRGERYNGWRYRFFVLKGPHLYWLKTESDFETKIKGYVNLAGYRVIADENLDPGRYGFRIVHDTEKEHLFSSDEQTIVREWMKAIIKTSIERDYTRVVVSSCNIPTIPLTVAQAMNPSPRPPSPRAREAMQRALRRENPNQLSSRDARVLMGLPVEGQQQQPPPPQYDSYSSRYDHADSTAPPPQLAKTAIAAATNVANSLTPPRPAREQRRTSAILQETDVSEVELVEWVNSLVPTSLQVTDISGCSGLVLLRLAEAIRGHASIPPVPDSAFPSGPTDDKLDGLFRLFDFLLDNGVRMGSISINDLRQSKRDKIVQLVKALKAWEDKKKTIAQSLGSVPVSPSSLPGW